MLSKVSELDNIPSARCSYLKRRSGTQSWAASAHGNEEVDSEEPKTIILVWCSKWAAHTKHKKESKILRWNSIFLFPNYINTGIVIQMTYMLGWACDCIDVRPVGTRAGQAGYQQILVDVSPAVTRCNYCSSGNTMNIVTDRYRLNKHQYYLYCPHLFYIIFIKYSFLL